MLNYVLDSSKMIGRPNKTFEIDESKLGRRKYYRRHALKGQRVFGGVERESGRTFLVPVLDRRVGTLMTLVIGSGYNPSLW